MFFILSQLQRLANQFAGCPSNSTSFPYGGYDLTTCQHVTSFTVAETNVGYATYTIEKSTYCPRCGEPMETFTPAGYKEVAMIPPSRFVQNGYTYKQWCDVTECTGCGAIGKYEDTSHGPCRFCGHVLEVKIGRWIDTSPWWKFWVIEGYWELKDE